jgi:3-oxoacid CoA-transferase subunit A
MRKTHDSAAAALAGVVADGMTIAVGGFGLCGVPFDLVEAIADGGATGLTIVSNNMCVDGVGLGLLLERGQVRRVIASYVGENKALARAYLDGSVTVELTPQGTLAERLRAAGAGIAAFYTPTGAGTNAARGKPVEVFDGVPHVLETALHADLGLVHAREADREGNLRYWRTARNFNPLVAAASALTVVETEKLTDTWLDPDAVVTPGIHVDRLVLCRDRIKPIERLTTRPSAQTREERAHVVA